ncbi:MAG: type I DNA topoisomerase [Eubacteriales bacterium]|nr:type I DNA topoisomerase [Eubacteriales bacterium]
MRKTLVIVESPAKAKTIGRYLGNNYRIAASVGHIRDLPSTIMGVDVRRNFTPVYIPMKGKDKVIKELKTLAADSENVLIATDPDREGEAIAWHIAVILKIDPASDCRITFNEITENSVKSAVSMPRPIDMDLVNAQQARRILDRLVGYELSPLLWSKVRKGLSAGRVQSVATRMVVDREEEINSFIPEEYWLLTALLSRMNESESFKSSFAGKKEAGKFRKIRIKDEEQKNKILEDIKGKDFIVDTVRKGTKKRKPYPPYTTSTLQQDASKVLGYSSKRTMSVAQQLYEGVELKDLGQTALLTYIRTDSVRSSDEAIAEIRDMISAEYGNEFIPSKNRHYSNKNKSQDAHEAIRPAHFDIVPDKVEYLLSKEQFKLYKLIWNRFMASQMSDAIIDTVNADIAAGVNIFRSSGEKVVFPGFLVLYNDFSEEKSNTNKDDNESDDLSENIAMPDLSEGDKLICRELKPEQKFTQPPARYTEASLIKALEEEGIGRPSTYAPTISTILDRNYVNKDGKQLKPTDLGSIVTSLLKSGFDNIVDLKFTAEMEKSLDTVEEGKIEWTGLLAEFYPGFHKQITDATANMEKVAVQRIVEGEKCPECGGELYEKEGRYGKFIACGNYPECKYTRDTENDIKTKCPLCGSSLLVKVSRKHKNSKFYVCDKKGNDPDCPFISWDLPAEGKTCEICGKYMVIRKFGRRSFVKCSDKECPSNKNRASGKKNKEESS